MPKVSAIPQLVSAQWKTAGIMLCLMSGVRSFVGVITHGPPSFTSFRKEKVGSLSNYKDDHNDDFKKTMGLMKTTALHVHHAF